MSEKDDVLILAIESSCDETAAAVVKNGREVLSNVINTQIAIHTEYGGVVPEIASRKHIENINPVIRKALEDAGVTLDDIDAIGVTYGPGLAILGQRIHSQYPKFKAKEYGYSTLTKFVSSIKELLIETTDNKRIVFIRKKVS